MVFSHLRYLPTGHVFIDPGDDCDRVVDALLETGYGEEFCLARDFDEGFFRRLMWAGFLVMSTELVDDVSGTPGSEPSEELFFILLPKLHLVRSVLFFPELRIKKSVRPFLSRYELRFNTDFDRILDKCVEIHGAAWLTPPLTETLKIMRRSVPPDKAPVPVSFGVYRDGELRAGEIGIAAGRVYTSYSGYFEESGAGTVQMILMTQWLEKNGFDFLDFGMPLDYKTGLGARDIDPRRFVNLFRAARQ